MNLVPYRPGRGLVGAVAAQAGEAQGQAARVVGAILQAVEGDLDHQLGAHVHHVPLAVRLAGEQLLGLAGEHLVGHALEGLAQHHEAARGRVARAQVEVAEPALAAAAAPLGGEDHQVQGVGGLELEPAAAAAAGLVGGLEGLGDQALVAPLQGLLEEGLGGVLVLELGAGHPQVAGDQVREGAPALGSRPVDPVLAAGVEHVEEERGQGELGAQGSDVEAAAEAAHGDLEGVGASLRVQGEHLAVQHELRLGQGQRGLDQLGDRGGHLVQLAREHADLVAAAVDLDPGAVELPLEGGAAQLAEGGGGALGAAGQHGLDRPQELHAEAAERRATHGQGRRGDLAQLAAQHGGSAHLGRREVGCAGDRLDQDALEGALAQLADDEAPEEVLLLGRGAGEQGRQGLEARGLRARAGDAADLLEGAVGGLEGQPRLGGGAAGPGVADGGPAQTDAALAQLADEVGDADGDLDRRETRQELGEQADLLQPGAGLAHPPAGGDELGQEHAALGRGGATRAARGCGSPGRSRGSRRRRSGRCPAAPPSRRSRRSRGARSGRS